MTTTHETPQAVDGSWDRSDRAVTALRHTFGDVAHMTQDERAEIGRSATLSTYTRALLKSKNGFPADLEVLSRGLASMDELGRLVARGTSSDSTVPKLLVGPISRFVDTSRPAITVSNRQPMPTGGPSFLRPRTTQPSLVSAQGAETNVLPSQRWQYLGDQVDKIIVGFVVTMSEAQLDFGGEFSVQSLTQDVARSYSQHTDAMHCTAIQDAVTASDVLATNADAATTMATLGGAIKTFSAASNGVLPTVLFASVARASQLASLVDTAGRPVPGALLADALGVQLVVDPAFSDDGFLALAAAQYIEYYEPDLQRILQIGAPSTAELNISFSSSVASFVPANAVFSFPTS